MELSAYKWQDPKRMQSLFFLKLKTTVDVKTLTGILSRDIVLCNRINDGSINIHVFKGMSEAVIPMESASHPESDYGFGNVLFDIAIKETGV
jgi:hypothetical protein